MTLTQLEYLAAVDACRHFATAASTCFVTQPTLSMQIHKLEEELGVKIFDRSKQPVVPTEVGKKLIEQARVILRESVKMKEIVRENQSAISGELKLGVIPTVAPYLLPVFVTGFLEKYPGINLVIEEMVTEEAVKALVRDEIDAGIVSTPLREPGMKEIPLYYEPIVAYVAESHPVNRKETITPEDLPEEDLWTLGEGHCFRNQVVNLCARNPAAGAGGNLQYQNSSMEFLTRLADMTGKITLLPEMSTYDWGEKKLANIRRITRPVPFREISLILQRNYAKQQLITALQSAIRSRLKPELLEMKTGEIIEWR